MKPDDLKPSTRRTRKTPTRPPKWSSSPKTSFKEPASSSENKASFKEPASSPGWRQGPGLMPSPTSITFASAGAAPGQDRTWRWITGIVAVTGLAVIGLMAWRWQRLRTLQQRAVELAGRTMIRTGGACAFAWREGASPKVILADTAFMATAIRAALAAGARGRDEVAASIYRLLLPGCPPPVDLEQDTPEVLLYVALRNAIVV